MPLHINETTITRIMPPDCEARCGGTAGERAAVDMEVDMQTGGLALRAAQASAHGGNLPEISVDPDVTIRCNGQKWFNGKTCKRIVSCTFDITE